MRPLCCHCPGHRGLIQSGHDWPGEGRASNPPSAIFDHHTVRKAGSAGAAFMLSYIYPSLVCPGDRVCADPCPAPPRGLQDAPQVPRALVTGRPYRPHLASGGATPFLPVPPRLCFPPKQPSSLPQPQGRSLTWLLRACPAQPEPFTPRGTWGHASREPPSPAPLQTPTGPCNGLTSMHAALRPTSPQSSPRQAQRAGKAAFSRINKQVFKHEPSVCFGSSCFG